MTTNTSPAVVYDVTEFKELQGGGVPQYAVTELPRPADARAPAVERFECPCGIHCGAMMSYFPFLFQQG